LCGKTQIIFNSEVGWATARRGEASAKTGACLNQTVGHCGVGRHGGRPYYFG